MQLEQRQLHSRLNLSPPDKMAAISQTIFSDASSLMKNLVFWLKFHWDMFLGFFDNIQAFVYIMARRLFDDNPLSEPMHTRFTDADMQY